MFETILRTFSIFILSFIVYLTIRFFLIRSFNVLTKKTSTQIDDIILHHIKIPSILIGIIISLHITIEFSNLPEKYHPVLIKSIYTLFIASVTVFFANISVAITKHVFELKKLPTTGTTLTFIIIQVLIYLTGTLVLLSYLNIPIAPLITTLGIGGLAVGLALKDTLSNIFSGLYILIEKRVSVGDFIEIDEKKRGFVIDINWRTTVVKTLSEDFIIIPNEKLAQSIIVNYSKPIDYIRTSIEIPVSYDTDIDKFEKVVMEEVELFSKEDDAIISEPKPVLRFEPGFGNSSLNFTLFVFCKDYNSTFYVKSQLRKRIIKRLRKEKIEIPYNKLDVYIKEKKD